MKRIKEYLPNLLAVTMVLATLIGFTACQTTGVTPENAALRLESIARTSAAIVATDQPDKRDDIIRVAGAIERAADEGKIDASEVLVEVLNEVELSERGRLYVLGGLEIYNQIFLQAPELKGRAVELLYAAAKGAREGASLGNFEPGVGVRPPSDAPSPFERSAKDDIEAAANAAWVVR